MGLNPFKRYAHGGLGIEQSKTHPGKPITQDEIDARLKKTYERNKARALRAAQAEHDAAAAEHRAAKASLRAATTKQQVAAAKRAVSKAALRLANAKQEVARIKRSTFRPG